MNIIERQAIRKYKTLKKEKFEHKIQLLKNVANRGTT